MQQAMDLQLFKHSEVAVAIAVQLDFHDSTIDQYDQINEGIGLLPGGPASPHELFHWVTETSDGFRVIDVWETREAFEEFEHHRLQPMYREVGMRVPPEIQFFEVHNYFAGGRWRP
jgi:hypothetical protein